MGLDTTHGCWHGSYGAFCRWRNELARVAGYTFSKEGHYECPNIDRGCAVRVLGNDIVDEWKSIPVRPDGTPDPLIILIAHSDCEGTIAARFCGPLADRLENLLPLLPTEDDLGHIGNWRVKTQAFIDGLRVAAAANEPVEFH